MINLQKNMHFLLRKKNAKYKFKKKKQAKQNCNYQPLWKASTATATSTSVHSLPLSHTHTFSCRSLLCRDSHVSIPLVTDGTRFCFLTQSPRYPTVIWFAFRCRLTRNTFQLWILMYKMQWKIDENMWNLSTNMLYAW